MADKTEKQKGMTIKFAMKYVYQFREEGYGKSNINLCNKKSLEISQIPLK